MERFALGRFVTRVLLLVPVLIAVFGARAEAWCVHNETDRTVTVEFTHVGGTYYRKVDAPKSAETCETIVSVTPPYILVDTELSVRVTSSHGFDGVATAKSGGDVWVSMKSRSGLGVSVPLVFIETTYDGSTIDREPSWALEDDSDQREVRFLATADPQYIQENGTGTDDAAIWNRNARDITSMALGLVGTGDRRGRRGVIVAGDLTQDAWYQMIDWYFTSIGGPGGRFDSIGGLGRLVYDGLGNHDYADHTNGCQLIGQCPQKLWDDLRERQRSTNYTHRAGGEAVHYSWDWHDVHFVQLNLAPTDTPTLDPGTPGTSFDTHNALTFLKNDLAWNVGSSGRPVVLIHHYGIDCFSTGSAEPHCAGFTPQAPWWSAQQREDYWEAIAGHNVIALLTGHVHLPVDTDTANPSTIPFIEWQRPGGRTDGPNRILDVVAGAARSGSAGVNKGAMTDVLIERDWLYAGRLDENAMGASGPTNIYPNTLIYFGTPHPDIDPVGVPACNSSGCTYAFKGFSGVSEKPAGLPSIAVEPVTYGWTTSCGVPVTASGDTASIHLAPASSTGTCTITLTVTNSRDSRKYASFTSTITHSPRAPFWTTVPAGVTREITSPAGATYVYHPQASDPQGEPVTIDCTKPSGSFFPLGVTTVTCTAVDSEGISISLSFTVTVVDTVPPSVIATVSPAPNEFGWNNTPASVTWTIVEVGGIAEQVGCVNATNISLINTFSCRVKDAAGHNVPVLVTVRVDQDAPTIAFGTPVSSIPPNANGWYRTAVTIPYTIADTRSKLAGGVTQQTISLEYTDEGDAVSYVVTAVDLAGNVRTQSSPALKIDRTPPTISAARDRGPNGFNWYKDDVTVTFSCGDGLSQIETCTAPQTVHGEGLNLSAIGHAIDRAGNETPFTESGINLDRTAPSTVIERLTPANAHGWNNGPVHVRVAATDDLSGLVAPLDQVRIVAGEGLNQSVDFSVIDKAGNGAVRALAGINIDLTKPAITAQRSHGPNGNNWYNTDVGVSFTCADALATIDTCSPPATLSGDAANQSATGVAVDQAGNQATATEAGINIDQTAPIVIGTRLTPANANGWNNTDVEVSFMCSDALSTIATCGPTHQTITEEGAGLSRSAAATDLAGNQASATVGGVNIDKTAPVVACAANPDVLWPANNKLVPVRASMTVDGGIAGSAGFVLRSAGSNEPASGDIQGFVVGAASLSGELRASRDPKGSGRTYLLVYEGGDLAGNLATCNVAVRVPRTGNEK